MKKMILHNDPNCGIVNISPLDMDTQENGEKASVSLHSNLIAQATGSEFLIEYNGMQIRLIRGCVVVERV